jgi:hypothetical protein
MQASNTSNGLHDCQILHPVADSYITNKLDLHGSDEQLLIGRTPGTTQALMRFDLSTIPAGAQTTITTANLHLTLADRMGPADFAIHRVTAPWNEASVSGQSFAAAFDPTVEAGFDNYDAVADVQLKGLVSEWVQGGAPNYGLLIDLQTPDTGYFTTSYFSRESASETLRPELHVCFKARCKPGTPGCGACSQSCDLANASSACVDGVCVVTACQPGFADCDNFAGNGCETDLSSSQDHCGACGARCALPNASAICDQGVCNFVGCVSGAVDCDRNPANGCEPAPCGIASYCVSNSDCASGLCSPDGFCLPSAAFGTAWAPTAPTQVNRTYHTAVLLNDGRVLVVGGATSGGTVLASAELYDPVKGTWKATGSMGIPRAFHTATLLSTGEVLVTGGVSQLGSRITASDTAELFDPAAGLWFQVGRSMTSPRQFHTATVLANGKVLLAGGLISLNSGVGAIASAELFDPSTSSFTAVPPMKLPHRSHIAIKLTSGKVLVAGGINDGGGTLPTAEIFDPASSSWTYAADMNQARYSHTATMLASGGVLVVGGAFGVPGALASTEIYNDSTNTWTLMGPMGRSRYRHTAETLPNGTVLVTGGFTGSSGQPESSAERYEPTTGMWSPVASMTASRAQHTCTSLGAQGMLVVGGIAPGAEHYGMVAQLGTACSAATDCASGYCVDGVCCNQACGQGTAACSACSTARGASVNGACTPLTGNACDDGNVCTTVDRCNAGTCVGSTPVVCGPPPDICYNTTGCDPLVGRCVYPWLGGSDYCDNAPDLDAYLAQHPNIAAAIDWQFQNSSTCCDEAVYPSDRHAWPAWSDAEKEELRKHFRSAWHWSTTTPGDTLLNLREYIADPPLNVDDPAKIADDTQFAETYLTPATARELFLSNVAHALLVEIGGLVPWSITGYDDTSLKILLSSETNLRASHQMPSYLASEFLTSVSAYDEPSYNAPPRQTYAYIVQHGMLGPSRIDTIGALLQWARVNLVHFNNASSVTFGVGDAIWHYRGNPPITRILSGTASSMDGGEFEHWTAGCHGTIGFLRGMLRAVNIPVQELEHCFHAQAYFPTEDRYLDHGDDPYNQIFKNSSHSTEALLIDRATYTSWFGTDGLAPADENSVGGCQNIGRQVSELGP